MLLALLLQIIRLLSAMPLQLQSVMLITGGWSAASVASPSKVIVLDRELALIKALKAVFPESTIIVCVWHIKQKILAKCKEVHLNDEIKDDFMRSWNEVISQPSEQLFYDYLRDLEAKFNVSAKEVVTHLHDHWLPYKEHFVHAWTNRS